MATEMATMTKAQTEATWNLPTGEYTLTCQESTFSGGSYSSHTCGKPAAKVEIRRPGGINRDLVRFPLCNFHVSVEQRRKWTVAQIEMATADDAEAQRGRKVAQAERDRVEREDRKAKQEVAHALMVERRTEEAARPVPFRYSPEWGSDYGLDSDHETWTEEPRWIIGSGRIFDSHTVKVEQDRAKIWTIDIDHRTYDVTEAKALVAALSAAILKAEAFAAGADAPATTTTRPDRTED